VQERTEPRRSLALDWCVWHACDEDAASEGVGVCYELREFVRRGVRVCLRLVALPLAAEFSTGIEGDAGGRVRASRHPL
jgi:hypothetical protein